MAHHMTHTQTAYLMMGLTTDQYTSHDTSYRDCLIEEYNSDDTCEVQTNSLRVGDDGGVFEGDHLSICL